MAIEQQLEETNALLAAILDELRSAIRATSAPSPLPAAEPGEDVGPDAEDVRTALLAVREERSATVARELLARYSHGGSRLVDVPPSGYAGLTAACAAACNNTTPPTAAANET